MRKINKNKEIKDKNNIIILVLTCSFTLINIAWCNTNSTSKFESRATPQYLKDAHHKTTIAGIPTKITFAPSEVYEMELKKLIEGAQKTVDIAVFSIDDPSIIRAINIARKNNVHIRIVADEPENPGENKPTKRIQELIDDGILKLIANDNAYMHHKFMIIDNQKTWVGTGNFTKASSYNDEAGLIFEDSDIAEKFTKEFQWIWESKTSKNPNTNKIEEINTKAPIEIYFLPQDSIVKDRVIEEIGNAKKSITILSCIISEEEITNILIQKHKEGLEINIIVDRENLRFENVTRVPQLEKAGINVTKSSTRAIMHHKMMAIDGETVIFGTANLSKKAFEESNETMLIFKSKDIAKEIVKEFYRCSQAQSYEFTKWNQRYFPILPNDNKQNFE